MQGRLFDPDNPPLAFDRAQAHAELEEIKNSLRNRPGWIRHWDVSKTRIMDQFHDRRDTGEVTDG